MIENNNKESKFKYLISKELERQENIIKKIKISVILIFSILFIIVFSLMFVITEEIREINEFHNNEQKEQNEN